MVGPNVLLEYATFVRALSNIFFFLNIYLGSRLDHTIARSFLSQERIGRYASQLLSLVSCSWLPIRTNALICLGNSLFFHEPNRRRVENIDGALLDLLR